MSPPAPQTWIVKLGGSLVAADAVESWLTCLTESGPGRAVLVPGGGPFADQVRAAQQSLGFDDATAHHLALLAMEQFGRALCALRPEALQPADTASAIRGHLGRSAVPVWMPCGMTLGRDHIPESWSVTSDSLALWLAGQLGVPGVILIKSARPPSHQVSALSQTGYLDSAFEAFLERSGVPAFCLGPGDENHLAAALRDGIAPPDVLHA